MKAEDFRIVTIPEAEIDPSCLVCAFPFMVEYIGHGIWFGANTRAECESYILQNLV
jgi:hypothetical protein